MLNKFWDKISYIGVPSGQEHDYREVILSNRIVLISILLVIFFVPVEIILNGFELVPLELFCGALFGMVFYFHYKGWYRFSNYFIIMFTVIMVGFMTIMVGGKSGSEFVLMAITVTPMILFKDKLHMIIMVVVVIISFYFVRYLYAIVPPLVEIPLEVRESVQPFMMFMAIIILIAQVYYFKKLNQSYENLLNSHKAILEVKNKEITDSISYAKRIQIALLPPENQINNSFPNNFIYYQPKAIVAGDFYWHYVDEESKIIAVCDCTGHGVPGAMVSVICNNSLNRAISEYKLKLPGEILDKTRELVVKEFEKSAESVQDGMDISLLSVDKKSNTATWAGANNPLWLVRKNNNGEVDLIEYKGDKQPIGKYANSKPFTTYTIQLQPGDTLYLTTDGFQDQFGGDKGKKLKAKYFKEVLLTMQDKSMSEQKQVLDQNFENWKGHFEQNDDVCVIGIRV